MEKQEMKMVTTLICDGCHKEITDLGSYRSIVQLGVILHFCIKCSDTRDEQDTKSLTRMEAYMALLSKNKIKHESWKSGWVKIYPGSEKNPLIIDAQGGVETWRAFWAHFEDLPRFRIGWEVIK